MYHVQILEKNHCGAKIKDGIKSCQPYVNIRVIKYYAKKYSESTYLQIQSQHWLGERKLSMEGVVFDYFNNYNIVI